MTASEQTPRLEGFHKPDLQQGRRDGGVARDWPAFSARRVREIERESPTSSAFAHLSLSLHRPTTHSLERWVRSRDHLLEITHRDRKASTSSHEPKPSTSISI